MVDEMQADEARGALRNAGLECAEILPVLGGWASWTFEADGRWMVRFPRDADVARGHERERQLLPELAAHVDFAVPIPRLRGTHRGLPFHAYEKLPGRPLQPDDLPPTQVARVLAQLHSFPVVRARALLGDPGTTKHWLDGYRAFWPQIEERVVPLLSPDLAALVREQYRGFLATASFEPALVHGDLGAEHFLVGTGIGLIDFEDAAIGDPACDFAGFANDLGPGHHGGVTYAGAVARAYPHADLDLPARLRFYWWMTAIHEVLHALDTGDTDALTHAIDKLASRVRERRRVCAAVVRDDTIVVVEEEGLFWWLPGGGVEQGENEHDAVLRELHEETGMSGHVVGFLYERIHLRGTERCFLVASDDEPSTRTDDLVTGARWAPLDPDTTDWQLARVVTALATAPMRPSP